MEINKLNLKVTWARRWPSIVNNLDERQNWEIYTTEYQDLLDTYLTTIITTECY